MLGGCWRPVLLPYRFPLLSCAPACLNPVSPCAVIISGCFCEKRDALFVQSAYFPKLLDNYLTNEVETPMMSITQGWQLVNIFMRFFGIKFRLMENRENFPAALPSYSGLSPPISRPPAAEKRFMIRKETKHGQETRCHGR